MSNITIAVVNGTKARLFTLDKTKLSVCETNINLREHRELSNPIWELHDRELWANVKTGRNRGTNGQAHSYDDHRQQHKLELERQFIQKVTGEIAKLLESEGARNLILVAEPQIIGLMRETFKSQLFKTTNIRELSKDICHFSSWQIHDYLARKKILPTRSTLTK